MEVAKVLSSARAFEKTPMAAVILMDKDGRRKDLAQRHSMFIMANCDLIAIDAAEYREMYRALAETLPPCMKCPDFVIYFCAEENFLCENFETHMDVKKEK